MATLHVTKDELIRDAALLMQRAERGEEIVIATEPPLILHARRTPHMRLLSESLEIGRRNPSTAVLDESFARDIEEAIASHPEPLCVDWD